MVEKVILHLDKEGKETMTSVTLELPTDNNSNHTCSLYELYSIKQFIEQPTRAMLSRSSIVYHIATTSPSNKIGAGVHKRFMSDNCMVFEFVSLKVH